MADEGTDPEIEGVDEELPLLRPPGELDRMAIQAFAGVGTTAFTFGLGSASDMAAAGITPLAAYAVIQGIERLNTRWFKRGGEVVENASAQAGLVADQFVEDLAKDERKLLAFGRVVDAAACALAEEKLALLAAILVNIREADDPATLDEEVFFLDAIAAMEGPHISALRAVSLLGSGCPTWVTCGQRWPLPKKLSRSGVG
jgi:hypothetical protein